jgi:hypothetical protein
MLIDFAVASIDVLVLSFDGFGDTSEPCVHVGAKRFNLSGKTFLGLGDGRGYELLKILRIDCLFFQ